MPVSTDSLLAAFDALTAEQQRSLIEQLQRRMAAFSPVQPGVVPEIEVVGGYDLTYDDRTSKIPLPAKVVSTVACFTTRKQIKDYLNSLNDEEILWRYRFLQFRYLADGTLWQIFAHAHIHRGEPSAAPLAEKELTPIRPRED